MEDLTEAYLSIYDDIEESKTPVTRRSMGIESQFVDKTGEEKAKAKAKKLSNSTNLADRKRAKTITRTITTAADKEAAEAGVEARNRLLRRERDRVKVARDMNEKRLFPGAPDYEGRFPLNPEAKATLERIKKEREAQAAETAKTSKTKSASKPSTVEPEQNRPRRPTTNLDKVRIGESHDFYDLVLTHLLDEGYCDSQDSAVKMMAAMSEDWISSIVEEFVDPEHGETPSGRTPMQNIEDKPRRVRKKALRGFEKQMGKEYGGKWKYQER